MKDTVLNFENFTEEDRQVQLPEEIELPRWEH